MYCMMYEHLIMIYDYVFVSSLWSEVEFEHMHVCFELKSCTNCCVYRSTQYGIQISMTAWCIHWFFTVVQHRQAINNVTMSRSNKMTLHSVNFRCKFAGAWSRCLHPEPNKSHRDHMRDGTVICQGKVTQAGVAGKCGNVIWRMGHQRAWLHHCRAGEKQLCDNVECYQCHGLWWHAITASTVHCCYQVYSWQ